MNNLIYTEMKAGIPVMYIVVSTLILVMCAIRHSVNRTIF